MPEIQLSCKLPLTWHAGATQDDLGYPYWLGTDGFTGVYASRLNPTTGAKERVTDDPFGQHRATSQVRSSGACDTWEGHR